MATPATRRRCRWATTRCASSGRCSSAIRSNLTYTIVEVDPAKRRSYSEIKVVNQRDELVGVARHILAWVKDQG